MEKSKKTVILKADNALCFTTVPPTDLQDMMFTIYIPSRNGTGANERTKQLNRSV
jgi:hypothetical protein